MLPCRQKEASAICPDASHLTPKARVGRTNNPTGTRPRAKTLGIARSKARAGDQVPLARSRTSGAGGPEGVRRVSSTGDQRGRTRKGRIEAERGEHARRPEQDRGQRRRRIALRRVGGWGADMPATEESADRASVAIAAALCRGLHGMAFVAGRVVEVGLRAVKTQQRDQRHAEEGAMPNCRLACQHTKNPAAASATQLR